MHKTVHWNLKLKRQHIGLHQGGYIQQSTSLKRARAALSHWQLTLSRESWQSHCVICTQMSHSRHRCWHCAAGGHARCSSSTVCGSPEGLPVSDRTVQAGNAVSSIMTAVPVSAECRTAATRRRRILSWWTLDSCQSYQLQPFSILSSANSSRAPMQLGK